jgi:predicted lipoprotein with Yx(FWY)xxD motif
MNHRAAGRVVHHDDHVEETMMRARPLALLLTALLLLAACAGGDGQAADEGGTSEAAAAPDEAVSSTAEPPADTSEPAAGSSDASAAGGGIEVADTDLGTILVDADGMTLYVFDNDSGGTSSCTGDCEANWPPLTGDVTAGDGVDAGLLGTTERDDGSVQVTYADLPLYHFAGDQAAGDLNGQAVGGIWWVVGPDGAKITDEVSQADTTTDTGGY